MLKVEKCHICDKGRIMNFLDDVSDLIFLKNEKFEYIFINKQHELFLDIKVEEVIGKTDFDIMDEDVAKHCRESDKMALVEGEFSSEEKVDGKWYNIKKNRVEDESGFKGVFSIIRDVTAQKELEISLNESNNKDPLTGLYNRRYYEKDFRRNFEKLKSEDRKLSFIVLDLDSFKKINDNYGHLEGDRVIKKTGDIIESSIRKGDVPFRIGGEEFAIMLPDCSVDVAREVALRLKEKVKDAKFNCKGQEYGFTFSAGVSEMQLGDSDSNDLFLRADRKLYDAKKQGKDRVIS